TENHALRILETRPTGNRRCAILHLPTMKRLTPIFYSLVIILVLLLLSACGLIQGSPLDLDATPSPEVTAPVATIPPQTTAESPNSPPQAEPSPLRLWIPPEVGARTEAGAQELTSQIRAHQTARPNLEIIVEQKPVEGPGGILNYLQTGRPVAPSVM